MIASAENNSSIEEDWKIPFDPYRVTLPGHRIALLTSNKGAIYHGEYAINNQRDGRGVTLYGNGDAYAGEWCQNQRHGWGLFIREYGLKYEGTWSNDEQLGFGLQTQANDMRYMGEFKHNRKHGRGVVLQSNGLLYCGLWQDGEGLNRELLFQHIRIIFKPPSNDLQPDSTSPSLCISRPDQVVVSSTAGHAESLLRTTPTGPLEPLSSTSGSVFDGTLESIKGKNVNGSQFTVPNERRTTIVSKDEEENTNIGRSDLGIDSSPSVSSSSTPVFDVTDDSSSRSADRIDEKRGHNKVFARSFRRVQQLSSVIALVDWDAHEVAHLLYSCGIDESMSSLFVQHKITGRVLFEIMVNTDENLIDIGITNPYSRRFITIILTLLFKIRRRCIIERKFNSPASELQLTAHIISAEGLYLERRIGEGGYGRVYKGRYEITATQDKQPASSKASKSTCTGHKTASDESIPVAVKVFRSKNNSTGRRRYPERSAEFFCRLQRQQKALLLDFHGESEVLSHLRHPNITLFFGAVRFPLYCIVTEYVPCGSLFDLLHRHNRKLSLNQMVRISKELASTLAYIHSKDLIHCDLKSSNILLTEMGSVKVCDFGLATFLSQELDYTYNENGTDMYIPTKQKMDQQFVGNECPAMLGCVGTHQWMAPEVMRGEASTKASDVYSFGVIVWEMLTRMIPYKDMLSTHITAWVGYGGHNPHHGAIEEIWRMNNTQSSNHFSHNSIHDQEEIFIECCERTLLENNEARLPVANIPRPLSAILFRCLSANPESRPTSAALSAFFNALHRSAVIDIEENLRTFFGF